MALLAVFLVLVTASLSEQARMAVTEEMRSVANANNNFATKFAQYLKSAAPGDNSVFSPVSASTVLAGLAEAAAGRTRTQLLVALGLTDDDQLIRSGYRTILTSYDSSLNGNVTLSMADAFFVASQFSPKPSFMNVMRSDFKSEVDTVNFRADTAVTQINGWVSEHTNGRIEKLYEQGELPASTLLVLANAVYFKGSWKVSFNERDTSKQRFYLSSTQTVDVDMMTVTSKFVVYSDNALQADVLEIPYTGEQLKMVIVLPYEKEGLDKTIKGLSGIPKPSGPAYAQTYKIYVPKFKITATMDVAKMIQSFGVKDAFSSAANFSRLSSESIELDSVKQKAFVEVNEEGTEAAAATGAAAGAAGSVIPEQVPEFVVDHPFLYIIRHILTDTAVFAGYILNP